MVTKYDYELALGAYEGGDYAAVLKLAQPQANNGDPDAQCMLSLLYQGGFGVAQDFRKAEEWLIKATEQKSAIAWNNLGSLYASRLPGLSRGPEAAAACYQRAKELGFDCAVPYPPSRSHCDK